MSTPRRSPSGAVLSSRSPTFLHERGGDSGARDPPPRKSSKRGRRSRSKDATALLSSFVTKFRRSRPKARVAKNSTPSKSEELPGPSPAASPAPRSAASTSRLRSSNSSSSSSSTSAGGNGGGSARKSGISLLRDSSSSLVSLLGAKQRRRLRRQQKEKEKIEKQAQQEMETETTTTTARRLRSRRPRPPPAPSIRPDDDGESSSPSSTLSSRVFSPSTDSEPDHLGPAGTTPTPDDSLEFAMFRGTDTTNISSTNTDPAASLSLDDFAPLRRLKSDDDDDDDEMPLLDSLDFEIAKLNRKTDAILERLEVKRPIGVREEQQKEPHQASASETLAQKRMRELFAEHGLVGLDDVLAESTEKFSEEEEGEVDDGSKLAPLATDEEETGVSLDETLAESQSSCLSEDDERRWKDRLRAEEQDEASVLKWIGSSKSAGETAAAVAASPPTSKEEESGPPPVEAVEEEGEEGEEDEEEEEEEGETKEEIESLTEEGGEEERDQQDIEEVSNLIDAMLQEEVRAALMVQKLSTFFKFTVSSKEIEGAPFGYSHCQSRKKNRNKKRTSLN